MPVSSDSQSEEEVHHDSSLATSSWDSNVSIGDIFESLSVNMVSTSHFEDDGVDAFESKELIQSKHLNALWDTHFEQREPPTENKVTQKNPGDEANLSESLSPSEKEDLIQLIRAYIDVFAWNYEDMLGLDSQIAMHRLNINLDAKLVNNNNDDSVPRSWKQSSQKLRS